MKKFAVYNPITRKVLRTGQCVDESIQLQAREHEAVIELPSTFIRDAVQHYAVENGELVLVEE